MIRLGRWLGIRLAGHATVMVSLALALAVGLSSRSTAAAVNQSYDVLHRIHNGNLHQSRQLQQHSGKTTVHRLVRDWQCKKQEVSLAQAEVVMHSARLGVRGISPVLRERGCGARNKEPPRIWLGRGQGRFAVDVGLGGNAYETVVAVEHGFVVFSFEILPGNFESIQSRLKNDPKYFFVVSKQDSDGHWITPTLPDPPKNGSGFAYIHFGGLANAPGTVKMVDKVKSQTLGISSRGSVHVPLFTLDAVLPSWARPIEFVKLDTQGAELMILKGAKASLSERRFKYVQYEFSPWLMQRGKFGDPLELLYLLPQMGAVCFDMMGQHNALPRPSEPLEQYYKTLNEGKNGDGSYNRIMPRKDPFGPWDDIMCYWPDELNSNAYHANFP